MMMEPQPQDIGMRLGIELGTPLYIEIDGVDAKLRSHLVGMEPGKYLIVTTPHGPQGLETKFFEGNGVTVRYVYQGSVYGFEARLLAHINLPANLMFLTCPRVIAEQSLRKAPRIDCYLNCEIETGDFHGEGTVVDISTAGCRCIMPKHDSQTPAADTPITLTLSSDEDSPLTLQGNIVNVMDYHSAARVGIRFEEGDDATHHLLEKLVLSLSLD